MKKHINNKGISLIVLVITIIVMIILATSVVLTLSNSGIISKANDAVDATDLANMQDLATMLWADKYIDLKEDGVIDAKDLEDLKKAVEEGLKNADKNYATKYNVEVTEAGVTVTNKMVYFNRPYVYKTTDANGNEVTETYVFYEDGSAEKYASNLERIEMIEAGTCVYSFSGVTMDDLFFEFAEDGYNLICDGEMYALEQDLMTFYIVYGTPENSMYYKMICYAKRGMTWKDWCTSDYSSDVYLATDSSVSDKESTEPLYNDESYLSICIGTANIDEGIVYFKAYYADDF